MLRGYLVSLHSPTIWAEHSICHASCALGVSQAEVVSGIKLPFPENALEHCHPPRRKTMLFQFGIFIHHCQTGLLCLFHYLHFLRTNKKLGHIHTLAWSTNEAVGAAMIVIATNYKFEALYGNGSWRACHSSTSILGLFCWNSTATMHLLTGHSCSA